MPLLLAIVAYDCEGLPYLPSGTAGLLLTAVPTLALLSFFLQKPSLSYGAACTTFAAVFILGWIACYITDIRHDPRWFGHTINQGNCYTARVLETPHQTPRTWKLKLVITGVRDSSGLHPCRGEAFVYVFRSDTTLQLRRGDQIIVPGNWMPISNAGNPYEFDYARFCRRNGLYYQQFVRQEDVFIGPPATRQSLLNRVHASAMESLALCLKDPNTLGLLQAMLLGDDAHFDPELRQAYSDTGVIHIVAISGAHVAVFFWIVSAFFFWLKGSRFDVIRYLVALPIVCFYVAVAGAPASAVRSAVMFSYLSFALFVRRESGPLNQLFATAFFMLLYQPSWLFSIGFQLSFLAVLSLMLFYAGTARLIRPKNFVFRWLWKGIAASIAAEILIAPLVAFYFHLLPLSFLPANIIAMACMGVLLSGGLLLLAMARLPLVAAPLATAITWLANTFNRVVVFFQSLNPMSLKHLYLSPGVLILVYLTLLFMALFLIRKRTRHLLYSLTALCILLIATTHRNYSLLQQRQLVVYNVPNGWYAELIKGNRFIPWLPAAAPPASAIAYATREMHIRAGAWHCSDSLHAELLCFGAKTLLVLKQPPLAPPPPELQSDHLFVSYRLPPFSRAHLDRLPAHSKLIISGAQDRFVLKQWKDSCRAMKIAAHFTLLDGAFVLKL